MGEEAREEEEGEQEEEGEEPEEELSLGQDEEDGKNEEDRKGTGGKNRVGKTERKKTAKKKREKEEEEHEKGEGDEEADDEEEDDEEEDDEEQDDEEDDEEEDDEEEDDEEEDDKEENDQKEDGEEEGFEARSRKKRDKGSDGRRQGGKGRERKKGNKGNQSNKAGGGARMRKKRIENDRDEEEDEEEEGEKEGGEKEEGENEGDKEVEAQEEEDKGEEGDKKTDGKEEDDEEEEKEEEDRERKDEEDEGGNQGTCSDEEDEEISDRPSKRNKGKKGSTKYTEQELTQVGKCKLALLVIQWLRKKQNRNYRTDAEWEQLISEVETWDQPITGKSTEYYRRLYYASYNERKQCVKQLKVLLDSSGQKAVFRLIHSKSRVSPLKKFGGWTKAGDNADAALKSVTEYQSQAVADQLQKEAAALTQKSVQVPTQQGAVGTWRRVLRLRDIVPVLHLAHARKHPNSHTKGAKAMHTNVEAEFMNVPRDLCQLYTRQCGVCDLETRKKVPVQPRPIHRPMCLFFKYLLLQFDCFWDGPHCVVLAGDHATKMYWAKMLLSSTGKDVRNPNSKVVAEFCDGVLLKLKKAGMRIAPIVYVDNGKEFFGEFIKMLANKWGVSKANRNLRRSKIKIPQGRGFIERGVSIVRKERRTLFREIGDVTTYPDQLSETITALNSKTRSSENGDTPCQSEQVFPVFSSGL